MEYVESTWNLWGRVKYTKIDVFGRYLRSKDNLARDGAADAERKTVKIYNGGPETIVSDVRSIFSISSVNVVLLYVLTVIARIENFWMPRKEVE